MSTAVKLGLLRHFISNAVISGLVFSVMTYFLSWLAYGVFGWLVAIILSIGQLARIKNKLFYPMVFIIDTIFWPSSILTNIVQKYTPQEA